MIKDRAGPYEPEMERTIEVQHVSLEVNADFESFTKNLEQSLGRFDDSMYKDLETDPATVQKRLEKAAGEEGLMLFTIREHGKILNILGAPKKAKQYVLGNPLIAIKMTRHDIRAGLYAPLRIFVYEADDHSTRVEFDRPSSLFGQFDDPEVTAIAQSLDMKLANVIKKAEQAANEAGAIRI
jgi:uncharacterized protein (DUF302 family)